MYCISTFECGKHPICTQPGNVDVVNSFVPKKELQKLNLEDFGKKKKRNKQRKEDYCSEWPWKNQKLIFGVLYKSILRVCLKLKCIVLYFY